ncbi:uncharacterized protein EMH_0026190 [Eimeria mitis]|uniref:Uncharacterized protein n=1 Tax=Eimeria mitis TaxID=44415 RepID=U6KKU3_9EIME|nr:uncharacterized protein EMH_0026190 [Eimeria mitis]CDJ36862.1 hypothetical protein EMH_0026190 [Eimeria mitis]
MQSPTPTAERSPQAANSGSNGNSSNSNSNSSSNGACSKPLSVFSVHGSAQLPYATSGVESGMSNTGKRGPEAALELNTAETTAGAPWDMDNLLGLKRVGPKGPSPGSSSAHQAATSGAAQPAQVVATSEALGSNEVVMDTSKELRASADATVRCLFSVLVVAVLLRCYVQVARETVPSWLGFALD